MKVSFETMKQLNLDCQQKPYFNLNYQNIFFHLCIHITRLTSILFWPTHLHLPCCFANNCEALFRFAAASFIHDGFSGSVSCFSFSTSPRGGREDFRNLASPSHGGVFSFWVGNFPSGVGTGGLLRN